MVIYSQKNYDFASDEEEDYCAEERGSVQTGKPPSSSSSSSYQSPSSTDDDSCHTYTVESWLLPDDAEDSSPTWLWSWQRASGCTVALTGDEQAQGDVADRTLTLAAAQDRTGPVRSFEEEPTVDVATTDLVEASAHQQHQQQLSQITGNFILFFLFIIKSRT